MPIIVCYAVLAAAYLVFMIYAGLPFAHSTLFNYAWIVGYTEVFQSGTLLPRFLPTLNGGIGGFDFFFYGPLPFWLTSAVAVPLCIGCAQETPFIAMMSVLSLVGSVGIYMMCRPYFGPLAAGIGAVFYAILPYHLWVDWFLRQAAGEFAAYAFLPFIAIGMDRLRQKQRGAVHIVFGVAGTILCHLPSALLAVHVFGLIALAIIFHPSTPHHRRWSLMGQYVGWSALGILLASFYWLPALALLPNVSSEALYVPHFQATNWLFGIQNDFADRELIVGNLIAFALAFVICVIAGLTTHGIMRIYIVLPILFALVMNTQIAAPLWEWWIIDRVQFPWRLLVFADIATAMGIAAIISSVVKKALHALAIVPLVAIVMSTSTLVLGGFAAGDIPGTTTGYSTGYGPAEYFSPARFDATAEIRADLQSAEGVAELNEIAVNRMARAYRAAAADTFTDYDAQGRLIRLRPALENERVLAPLQYWFLWTAHTVDGAALVIEPNPTFGTIDILPPETGFADELIEIRLTTHWSETWGALMSGLAALTFATMAVVRSRRRPGMQSVS
ncbi:MAG: hypothetical protein AAF801_03870 [Pseudomonadota bacterium]